MPPTKTDLRRTLDSYRARKGDFRILDVPPMRYLALDGTGDPNTSPDFTAAVQTLYPVAYALKFLSKNELERDYVVPPLEALWWADDMAAFTGERDKDRWQWTVLIAVPEWLDDAHVEHARSTAAGKNPPRLDDLRVETLHEGQCVQTLHVGPFDAEGPVLAELHDRYIPDHGLRMTGRHHEIYLSDIRRAAPEKLRTVLRQPVVGA